MNEISMWMILNNIGDCIRLNRTSCDVNNNEQTTISFRGTFYCAHLFYLKIIYELFTINIC